MNGNRGQYTSAPLNHMKNKRPAVSAQPGEQDAHSTEGRRFGWLALVLSVVLPVLFLLALLIPSDPLRWAFLIVAALAMGAMWLLGAFVQNARSTLTVVYGALAVVIGLALFMSGQSPEARIVSNRVQEQGSLFSDENISAAAQNQMNFSPRPTTTAAPTVSLAQQRLVDFLGYWAQGNVPEMLKFCTPSWVSKQESPESALYLNVVRNSRPTSYQIENAQGSDGDGSRTITLKATMDYQNGTAPALYRMNVLMFQVNNVWYVDPVSLGGTLVNEAEEAARKTVYNPASTIVPTNTPVSDSSALGMVLYYNKTGGGKCYHTNRICPSVNEDQWPLDGVFYYSQLNDQNYKHLTQCVTCNAPERPNVY